MNKDCEIKNGTINTMRKIRDDMSIKILNMTFEEERAYLDEILKNTNIIKDKDKEKV